MHDYHTQEVINRCKITDSKVKTAKYSSFVYSWQRIVSTQCLHWKQGSLFLFLNLIEPSWTETLKENSRDVN